MRLSKTSALAALAIAYLADPQHHGPIQARQVAEHLNIPTDSALKVLQSLSRSRLIASQLGRTGGYRLRKPVAGITLLEVVEAIDGPVSAEVALTSDLATHTESLNLLQAVCQAAVQRVRYELEHFTIADLARCNHADILATAG
jgi:Rrf2 family protein